MRPLLSLETWRCSQSHRCTLGENQEGKIKEREEERELENYVSRESCRDGYPLLTKKAQE